MTEQRAVRRYEWVRSGMACVNEEVNAIPWCEQEYFVLDSDYEALKAQNAALVEALLSAYRHMKSTGAHESYLSQQRALLIAAGHQFDDAGYYVPALASVRS